MEVELIEIEIREELPVGRQLANALNLMFRELHQIRKAEIRIMSAIDDLKSADLLEASALATIGQAVSDVATRVAALGAGLPTDDPAVAATAADLQAHAATMQQLATALAAIAPAATVTNPPANPVTT